MNQQIWQELVLANREARELIESATPASLEGKAGPSVLGERGLEALHGDLRALLVHLARRLAARVDKRDLKQIAFVLAIQLDELVQRRLTPSEESKWPLLQRALFNIDHGGDVLYDVIDKQLGAIDAPPLLLQLLYFCLSDGFVGRHSRSRRKIDEYKVKLAARIGGKPARMIEEATTFHQQQPLKFFPVHYYLVTAALVLTLPVVLLLVSW